MQNKKRTAFGVPITLTSILVISCVILFTEKSAADNTSDQLTVLGLDAMGSIKAVSIPVKLFRNRMGTALSSVQDSLLPALENATDKTPASIKRLQLRSLGVGVGITGQFGLGPLINVTLSPRLRMVFSNSLSPVYPD